MFVFYYWLHLSWTQQIEIIWILWYTDDFHYLHFIVVSLSHIIPQVLCFVQMQFYKPSARVVCLFVCFLSIARSDLGVHWLFHWPHNTFQIDGQQKCFPQNIGDTFLPWHCIDSPECSIPVNIQNFCFMILTIVHTFHFRMTISPLRLCRVVSAKWLVEVLTKNICGNLGVSYTGMLTIGPLGLRDFRTG